MAKALTKRVVKATTLLGSTHGINMVCSVVRMKLLSVIIGPFGVGMVGAIMQAHDTIGRLTELSIRTSAVRDLAAASPARRRDVQVSVTRYGRLLGLVGFAVMFLLSPWLSEFAFASREYTWSFRIVALSLLFVSLQGTHHIILQADTRYKAVAASSATTAIVGILFAVPLYLLLGVDGIAPSIVVYSVVSWLGAMWFTRRQRVLPPLPSWKESLRVGKGFLVVGVLITVTGLAQDLINFGFMAYVERSGEEALGLFQAGYTMLWRYTGIFFMAYGLEFYPRLSRTAHAPSRMAPMLTHQSVVSTMMLLPCAVGVIILAPWLIRILFSGEFLPALPYVTWGMAGMLMRPLSMTMSFSFLAANRGKVYCITELVSSIVGFACNVAGYHFFGFFGLGLSTVAWCVLDLAIILTVARIYRLPMARLRALWICLASAGACLLTAFAVS